MNSWGKWLRAASLAACLWLAIPVRAAGEMNDARGGRMTEETALPAGQETDSQQDCGRSRKGGSCIHYIFGKPACLSPGMGRLAYGDGSSGLVHGIRNGLPQPFRLRFFEVLHHFTQPVCPFPVHSDHSMVFLYSFIFFASMFLALWNCEADVLSVMPSISAISLWLFSSNTNRLNTVLYPSGSCRIIF